MRQIFATLFYALFAFSFFLSNAHALKCAEESFVEKVQRAPIVFVGEIITKTHGNTPETKGTILYSIRIVRLLKRDPKRPLKVGSLFSVRSGGFQNALYAKVGKLYLFFNTTWLCDDVRSILNVPIHRRFANRPYIIRSHNGQMSHHTRATYCVIVQIDKTPVNQEITYYIHPAISFFCLLFRVLRSVRLPLVALQSADSSFFCLLFRALRSVRLPLVALQSADSSFFCLLFRAFRVFRGLFLFVALEVPRDRQQQCGQDPTDKDQIDHIQPSGL